ncbi:hypothetical protein Tco_0661687 [Tanacetum coccineum]|uniref:Uncharacterized protein n=1 Tax=Tanacetum coccineum TaxID=301880 RepID=A0ABQ4XBF4_9ASTR
MHPMASFEYVDVPVGRFVYIYINREFKVQIRRFITVLETEPFRNVLYINEDSLGGLQRGSYSLSYPHRGEDRRLFIRTHAASEFACEYYRGMRRHVGFIALQIYARELVLGTQSRFVAINAAILVENDVVRQGGNMLVPNLI